MQVRCIDDECVYDFIKNDEIYEVESETFTSYRLKGIKDSYLKRRFEIVDDTQMEYILSNPTFTNEPVKIDNEKAVRLIEAYREAGKLILGYQILLVIHGIIIKLITTEIIQNRYYFKQVQ